MNSIFFISKNRMNTSVCEPRHIFWTAPQSPCIKLKQMESVIDYLGLGFIRDWEENWFKRLLFTPRKHQ